MLDSFHERFRIFVDVVYRDLSYKELAAKLDVDTASLSRYNTGKTLPSLEILQKFTVLGVSINWLLNNEGKIFSSDEYGQKAQTLLLKFIDNKQNELINDLIFTSEEIRAGIIKLHCNKESFFDYLGNYNIKFNQSAFENFLNNPSELSTEVEEVLYKIKFYFFLSYKGTDMEMIQLLWNNMLQDKNISILFKEGQREAFNKILNQMKSLIDKYLVK